MTIEIPKYQAFGAGHHGSYFVVYRDVGMSSSLMNYKTAKSYASMFGGDVYVKVTDHCAGRAEPPWMSHVERILWAVLFGLVILAVR